MSENQTTAADSIGFALQSARLGALKSPGEAADIERRRRLADTLQKLRVAIEHSLFLEESRKTMWLNALHLLTLEKAESLLAAILRENFRYKKGIRKLKFKEIPERVSEEPAAV